MRRRIVGLTLLAAALATVLFGVPLGVAVARYFIADEQHELERTADSAALAVAGDLTRQRLAGVLPKHEPEVQISVYTRTGALIVGRGQSVAGALVKRSLRGATATGEIGGRYAVAVPISDGDTVVGSTLVTVSRHGVYRRVATAWLAMAGLAATAVLVSGLVARRQARRLAAPLENLSEGAARLGEGDFAVRTIRSGVPEIDSVSNALDRTAVRLSRLVERERAFSSDASHQLRTPLTGLQLGLEAALADPSIDARAALNEALVTSRRLQETVTDLLSLARDTPRSGEQVAIAGLLEDLRVRWNGRLAEYGRPLRVLVEPAAASIAASAPATKQILEVLVDNAAQHGTGAVTVTARDAGGVLAVDVADEGPALEADPRDMFRRGPAGGPGEGHGIGLALAQRLAEEEGGRLALTSREPPTFTLLLPYETL